MANEQTKEFLGRGWSFPPKFERNDEVIAHLIASDPKVIEAISSWEWQKGMLPNGDAPVWRMNDLRDHFIKDFSQKATKAIE